MKTLLMRLCIAIAMVLFVMSILIALPNAKASITSATVSDRTETGKTIADIQNNPSLVGDEERNTMNVPEQEMSDAHGEGVGAPPDGIPDEYQCRVVFHGIGVSYSHTLVYVTLRDANGNPSADGVGYLKEEFIPSVNAMAGYDENTLRWYGDTIPYAGYELQGPCVVFYAEYQPQQGVNLESIYGPRAWDEDGNPLDITSWQFTWNDEYNEDVIQEYIIEKEYNDESGYSEPVITDNEITLVSSLPVESSNKLPTVQISDVISSWLIINLIGGIFIAAVACVMNMMMKEHKNNSTL